MKEHETLWDYRKTQSKYHFDAFATDHDQPIKLGFYKLQGDWSDELNNFFDCEEIESPKSDWYKKIDNEAKRWGYRPHDKSFHKIDVTKDKFPKIWKAVESLGLKDVKLNINLQKTGEGKWYHLDGMGSYTKEKNVEQEEKYASVFAMLTDWMPGQWLIFGNTTWEKWRAGECAYYDWEHIPHGTANFSHGYRWLLKIRGIKTPEFNKLIGE